MADPGQNENLKEILGFDPEESTGESSSSIPKPKDERYGWPENWQELFEKEAKNKLGHFDAKPLVIDGKNLFAAHKNEKTGEEMRTYYRFSKRKRLIGDDEQFEEYSYILIQPVNGNSFGLVRFNTGFESGRSSSAYFFQNKEGFDGIEFSSYFGTRDLRVTYLPDGQLKHFALSEDAFYISDDIDEMREIYDRPGVYVRNKNGLWHVESDDKELSQKIIEEDGTLTMKTSRGDRECDIVNIPLRINPEELLSIWSPDELRKNLTTDNLQFDEAWKGKDFVYEAGIKWDSLDMPLLDAASDNQ